MSSNKRSRNNLIGTDEVATDYKLQQFLEDVQKFTDRSKKSNEKHERIRKRFDDNKKSCLKRGLFENGFRSKPFLKENKARLKSNLNDLVKECAKTDTNEEENPSNSPSILERSYELGNQDVDKNNKNVISSRNEKAVEESERLPASGVVQNDSDLPVTTIIKDKNQLKNLLWEKYCERMKCTESVATIFPVEDHLRIAKQRINEMIYRSFLLHAKRYPTILRRIFSNDEIKRLAQVVVKDKVDKCSQTEDVTISDPIINNIQCDISTKKDPVLNFPHSSQNSCDSQKEAGHFFDLNLPKKSNTRITFLESLENEPDIYSPGEQNTSPGRNVTPPPSPLPVNIRECWAPSTLSTPRKPEIFSPTISQLQPTFQKQPTISPLEPLVIKQPNLLKNRRRKKKPQLQFIQNMDTFDSPQMCFPKRKRLAYSPHRL